MDKMERPSFEEALRKLESIVKKLENESITLEESVQLYEEGVTLSKFCTEVLDNAETKIEQVNEAHSLN